MTHAKMAAEKNNLAILDQLCEDFTVSMPVSYQTGRCKDGAAPLRWLRSKQAPYELSPPFASMICSRLTYQRFALASMATCMFPATTSIMQGPFFTPNAPERTVLIDPADPNPRLRVHGLVRDTSGTPLSGAKMEIWGVQPNGEYSGKSEEFYGRNTFYSGDDGNFAFETWYPVN